MAIPFPRMHIAESVINRIMNAMDGAEGFGIAPVAPPMVPNPVAEGLAIDDQIVQTSPAPMAAPPENQQAADDGLVASSVQGGSPFDGALVGSITGV